MISTYERKRAPDSAASVAITSGSRRHLFTAVPPDGEGNSKNLDVDRYEFLVYRLLRNALQAGNIFVRDSTQFRRFEDDLISDERWKDKDAVLRESGAPILLRPIEETLAVFREELEKKIALVNQRIENGANRHIKVRGAGEKRRWTLVYPSEEEPVNSPFFGELPAIGIADLLWFVHQETNFLSAFCRTLYILNCIDDVTVRQSAQKALNRGEGYHRFRRAIVYVNAGKLRVRTEAEQQIWNECSRLINELEEVFRRWYPLF